VPGAALPLERVRGTRRRGHLSALGLEPQEAPSMMSPAK
jgi:hypothetical protein